jgi:hypothetical protein
LACGYNANNELADLLEQKLVNSQSKFNSKRSIEFMLKNQENLL